MYKFKINELFYSIQGEGRNIGMPAVFVRLSGCNLKCPWCDTPDHNKINLTLSSEQLSHEIAKMAPVNKNIIFTGGEPLLQQLAIIHFMENHSNGKNVFVETNGTIEPLACLLKDYDIYWTVSPKNLDNKSSWQHWANEVKVVYTGVEDLKDYETYKSHLVTPLFLQPCEIRKKNKSTYNFAETIEKVKGNPTWKLSTQVHKLLNIR